MKKYAIITLVSLLLLIGLTASATTINFTTPVYITGATSATTSLVSVTPATSRTLIYDSFNEGTNQKVDTGYLLLTQVASTSASKIGIVVSYSQNGEEYYTNNIVSTTTTTGFVALGETWPTYTLIGNAVSSTTRVALKIDTPTRFTKLTFSSLVATSTVWGTFLPIITY